MTDSRARSLRMVTAIAASVVAAAAVTALVVAWRVLRPAEWADIGALEHACRADVIAAECTVTNSSANPVKTCFRVHLVNEATTARMTSVRVCPGRLDSWESRTIRAPWGGRVIPVCSGSDGNLDYSKCALEIDGKF